MHEIKKLQKSNMIFLKRKCIIHFDKQYQYHLFNNKNHHITIWCSPMLHALRNNNYVTRNNIENF